MEILNKYIKAPEFNEESLIDLKKLTEEYPYLQSAWIMYLKNLKVLNHPDFRKILKINSIRISNREKLFYFLNPDSQKANINLSIQKTSINQPGEYFSEIVSGEKNREDDLINNFIASQPSLRIKPENTETALENDFSAESITENEEFITETFAEILVQQKKYDKAIEAFRKLSLKIPEKNIYFAGRIEEINKLKN